ncbi:MAG: hypothetical protein FJ363_02530 [Gemmatimonadetes bacterium]|nr:hypothetical protein [Gemmatimonadota bacterium]
MTAHDSPAPARARVLAAIDKPIPAVLKQAFLAMFIAGFAVFAYGAAIGNGRAWQAFHVNWLFFTLIASAGVMFVAVQRITTARWSRSVIRLLEGFAAFLPFAFVALLLTIFVGAEHIYPWWDLVGTGELIHEKEIYFNHAFFWARSVGVFGLIMLLQVWYVWTSVRLDVGVSPERGASWAAGIRAAMRRGFRDERRELHSTHSRQGWMAVVMALLFGFGWVVMAWDHSMSLSYHFFSTIYGWQVFMGGWLAALMVFSALVRVFNTHLGASDLITEKQYHDIGKLCFAFTAFWGYLTFSQYLVIWYGNLPEETHFFTLRLSGVWTTTTVAVAVLVFVLPFFGLLSVKAKMWTPTMMVFAACSLVGIWLARYTEIYPSIYGPREVGGDLPALWKWNLALFVGYLGAFGWCYTQFMDAFPKMRVFLMTSEFRDEVQVPCDPETMEPLPAHE